MNEHDLSPTDLLHNDTASSQSRKRKTLGGASGRGVASLTPEQLAKKRANDREAQRAIRERTKNTIENLERRIQELTSQQPYQELQNIIRQKEAIQAENDEIRKRLANIMTIIQPIVGAQSLSSKQSLSVDVAASFTELASDLATAAQHNAQMAIGSQPNDFGPERYMNASVQQQPRPYTNSSSDDPNSYQNPFQAAEQEQEQSMWISSRLALNQQRESMQRNHQLNENGERLNFNFLLESIEAQTRAQLISSLPVRHDTPNGRIPHSATFPQLGQNAAYQPASVLQQPTSDPATNPPWSVLPKNCEPTCPLDCILLDFLHARQQENANNTVNPAYGSPAYPSVSSLLNPSNCDSIHSSPGNNNPAKVIDPLSRLMSSIISKFPNISALPEQAGVLFGMFLLMRWQIAPTEDNFNRVPSWLRPTPLQISHPHPAWMDHLFWPRMRDRVIANHQNYPFENWFLAFTQELSVNWPYEEVDCLIQTEIGGEPITNPVFERHIRRLENWTVGPSFAGAFPELADCVTIKVPRTRRNLPQGDYSQSGTESLHNQTDT